jgi:putative membrane protein
MFSEIVLGIFGGIFLGTFTGLVPGIHVNLISVLLAALPFNPELVCPAIVSMAVTHSILNTLPSIFLGAPDPSVVMSVLPGHKLLHSGQGSRAVLLTVIGSLSGVILALLILPILGVFIPLGTKIIKPILFWILLVLITFLILKETTIKRKLWGFTVFFISGILGIIVFSANIKNPLFPLFSGMFGAAGLLLTSKGSKIPEQKKAGEKVKAKSIMKTSTASVTACSTTILFPGLGPSQGAAISSTFFATNKAEEYLLLVGSMSTVDVIMSFAAWFAIDRARNGAVVVLKSIGNITPAKLILFSGILLFAAGIASILAILLIRIFAKTVPKINYKMLCRIIITFLVIITFFLCGWFGIIIFIISTAIGLIPQITGCSRAHAMGCLLLTIMVGSF